MGEITPQMVMTLRQRTHVGLGQCKAALVESGGDIEEAVRLLRVWGLSSSAKKEVRETREGQIGWKQQGKVAYLIEVNVETDFTSKNRQFQEFVQLLCQEALESGPSSVEDFLKQPYSKNREITIEDLRSDMVHRFGENVRIRRLMRLCVNPGHSLSIYSHTGGKLVSAVLLRGGECLEEVAYDLAMHVAADSPTYLCPEEVEESVIRDEKALLKEQIVGKKPPEVVEKIVQGKLRAYYEQHCLMNQKFVKDPSITIADFLMKQKSACDGVQPEVAMFIRWQVGE